MLSSNYAGITSDTGVRLAKHIIRDGTAAWKTDSQKSAKYEPPLLRMHY
jgi:predicted GIY-YIG superfamily endonuclease